MSKHAELYRPNSVGGKDSIAWFKSDLGLTRSNRLTLNLSILFDEIIIDDEDFMPSGLRIFEDENELNGIAQIENNKYSDGHIVLQKISTDCTSFIKFDSSYSVKSEIARDLSLTAKYQLFNQLEPLLFRLLGGYAKEDHESIFKTKYNFRHSVRQILDFIMLSPDLIDERQLFEEIISQDYTTSSKLAPRGVEKGHP
jgi:hypothetical protein